MKETVKGFNELTNEEKKIAVENYKNARLSDEDAMNYDYDSYTDEDWNELAADYSYLVQKYEDGSECIYFLL